HINQKTQFENPVLEAKRKKQLGQTDGGFSNPEQAKSFFTRDPSQLIGTLIRTSLKKSTMGFGFTIIGGDRPDEFLQVKNVLKDGPAAQDGKISSGDVIVDINGTCVLGHTHADVVQMFQLVPVNQYVNMTLCRGYPLPDESEDPVVDIVTATPVLNGQPVTKGDTCILSQDLIPGTVVLDHNSKTGHILVNGRLNGPSAIDFGEERATGSSSGCSQTEMVTIPLIKGPKGFGFAIADSPTGQKVKMILDSQWCHGLQKGDVIKEIYHQNVQNLTHIQVVEVLKQFPVGAEKINKQETSGSLEAIGEPVPHPMPFPPTSVKSSSPKLDPSEVYLKSKILFEDKPPNTKDLDVFLRKQESGFGFRIYIGAIIPLGAAEKDGRLRAADELVCIDGIPVKGKSHKQVLDLMTSAARNGQVLLTVRRKIYFGADKQPEEEITSEVPFISQSGSPRLNRQEIINKQFPEAYDVVLQRKENEGFGFVILTSKNKPPRGVIPHKIGRVIDGSPADHCGKLKVGDRISAVNGQSIIDLSHENIVQLIKDAGNTVTLTVIAEEEHRGPPSGANSAKQSPIVQHRVLVPVPASSVSTDRGAIEADVGKEQCNNYKHFSLPEVAGSLGGSTLSQNPGCYPVELERGPRGFGFSLRGGKEYNMGLFILRLAEEGPAIKDGRIHVGDQIVEINGEPTQGITHTRAIELIQSGGNKVLLLLRPGTGLIPDHGGLDSFNPVSSSVTHGEQTSLPSSSRSAYISEASNLPESEALMKFQMSEKLEKLKNTVPEKKSTLTENHLEINKTVCPQRQVNNWDHTFIPDNKVMHSTAQLASGNAASKSQSASPQKLSNSPSRDQLPFDRSKKSETKHLDENCLDHLQTPKINKSGNLGTFENADIEEILAKGKRDQSVSPQKYPKRERSREELNIDFQSKTAANANSSRLLKTEKVKLGVTKEITKPNLSTENSKYPSEVQYAKIGEQFLSLSKTDQPGKKIWEVENMKSSKQFQKSGLPDDSFISMDKNSRLEADEPFFLNKFTDNLELADKTKDDGMSKSESSSPVKKPIVPGPWKVPSTSRVTKAMGLTNKRFFSFLPKLLNLRNNCKKDSSPLSINI
ncbi:Membrane-associated guanylate kinase, WW and PDZ domain-containing protein 3, partial [Ophiophagus hannah]